MFRDVLRFLGCFKMFWDDCCNRTKSPNQESNPRHKQKKFAEKVAAFTKAKVAIRNSVKDP
jgi:hypothetical protein